MQRKNKCPKNDRLGEMIHAFLLEINMIELKSRKEQFPKCTVLKCSYQMHRKRSRCRLEIFIVPTNM